MGKFAADLAAELELSDDTDDLDNEGLGEDMYERDGSRSVFWRICWYQNSISWSGGRAYSPLLFGKGKGRGRGRDVVDWVGVVLLPFAPGMFWVSNLGYLPVSLMGLLGSYVLFTEDMLRMDDVSGLCRPATYGCGLIPNSCDGVPGVPGGLAGDGWDGEYGLKAQLLLLVMAS